MWNMYKESIKFRILHTVSTQGIYKFAIRHIYQGCREGEERWGGDKREGEGSGEGWEGREEQGRGEGRNDSGV